MAKEMTLSDADKNKLAITALRAELSYHVGELDFEQLKTVITTMVEGVPDNNEKPKMRVYLREIIFEELCGILKI